ncbi:ATP-binding protein [Magnetococcus sp. PR-3]|uniref:ATP-binding protein n=1 Tax=Magnetococcus sp. PR-3 TaxID=3120355 RepID=UPI002FCE114B
MDESTYMEEKPRILIVDDRPENILTIEETLRDLEAELVTARSGNEALSLLLDGPFALVIMDVHLPDLSGFEVVDLMSNVQRTKRIPIIFISAVHKDESHIFKGYYLGAVDYMLKPFEPAILRGKVSVFLALDQQGKVIERQKADLQRSRDLLEERVVQRTAQLSELNERLQSEMTARSVVEKALSSSEETLRNLLTYTPDVIISLNGENAIRFINRAGALPLPQALEVGDSLTAQLPTSTAKRMARAISLARGQQKAQTVTLAIGEASWWEAQILPSNTVNDGPSDLLLIIRDMTERRSMLTRMVRNAHLVTIGVLASSVAHEINNPNNAIQFNAAFINKAWRDAQPILKAYAEENGSYDLGGIPFEEVQEEMPKLLDGIGKNSNRIKEIVSSLKQNRRDAEVALQPVNMLEVVEEALSIHEHLLNRYGITVDLAIAGDLPMISGVQLQLEQVLGNVISNALEAMREQGGTLQIHGGVMESNERLVILVQDSGDGMQEDQMKRVCEPFFTTRQEQGGTGLGLSITSRILRDHGGELSFESEPGQGTLVRIELPTNKKGIS